MEQPCPERDLSLVQLYNCKYIWFVLVKPQKGKNTCIDSLYVQVAWNGTVAEWPYER